MGTSPGDGVSADKEVTGMYSPAQHDSEHYTWSNVKNLLKRIHARTLETVAPKGSGKGSSSWGYGCRHVKNGHVCRREEADPHRIHSCQCGLIAWAT